MPDTMTVNDAEYRVVKLLGKGKGGYSYLVTDGTAQYVLKQIHHEPCAYYTFGDKLRSELRDYETLRKLGIPMPRLLAADIPQERILKEYIAGQTVAELLKEGRMNPGWLRQVQAMCGRLRRNALLHRLRVQCLYAGVGLCPLGRPVLDDTGTGKAGWGMNHPLYEGQLAGRCSRQGRNIQKIRSLL